MHLIIRFVCIIDYNWDNSDLSLLLIIFMISSDFRFNLQIIPFPIHQYLFLHKLIEAIVDNVETLHSNIEIINIVFLTQKHIWVH